MKSHINIPIFIPHLGCPNTCVFCNQRKISGHVSFDMNSVRRDIDTALETIKPGQKCQIAYFGGSFTGIPREDMIELLTIAKSYIDRGLVDSIRLSTRPDYIDEEILNILKQYGVTSIELGLQSMRDTVLTSCKRGHTALDGINACKLIKKYGFELIGQMMTGLPGSSIDDEIYTAKSICEVGADGARIYPTVVFIDTELCDMAKSGSYNMPTEEDLINRTVAALKVFIDNNVNVIRIGLQSSEAVLDDDQTYSNSYHPSIGEICYSRVFRDKIDEILPTNIKVATIEVPVGCMSKAIGQRSENRNYLIKSHNLGGLKFKESPDLQGYQIKIIY